MLKRIIKYFKEISIFILLGLFLYISNSINLFTCGLGIQISYFAFILLSIIGVGIFSYKNAEKPSVLWSNMVVNGIIYMIAYSTLRSIIGTAQIENYFKEKFDLSNHNLHLFKTIFSMGYGIFQFFSGYLIGKFGNKIIGIFGFISSICILLINSSLVNNIQLLMLIRFINGIVVSCGVLSISYQLRILKVAPEKYSQIFSMSNTIAATMNVVVMNQLSNNINPVSALNILSYMFIIPSIIFIANGIFVKPSITEQKSENNTVIQEVRYSDVMKNALLDSRYNLMFLQSVMIVVAGWTLRDNFLMALSQRFECEDPTIIQSNMKYVLEIGFIYGFLFILFYLKDANYKSMMKKFVISNLISCMILLLNNYIFIHRYIIYMTLFTIGVSVKAHLLPQIMAGSHEKNTQLSAGIMGFLNAGVMLFALPFCQQIMPKFSLLISSIIFTLLALACTIISYIKIKDKNNVYNTI